MYNEYIAVLVERIVRDFDPLQIILFGSYARGDANQDSDVDLVVVFSEGVDEFTTSLNMMGAFRDIPVKDHIQIATPERLEWCRPRIGSVLRYAQQEGKVIYQKGLNIDARQYAQLDTLSTATEKWTLSKSERFEETARRLCVTREHLRTAEAHVEHPDGSPRDACWCARETVEFVLKAVLLFLEIDFRGTRNLDVLRDMLPDGWNLRDQFPDLSDLDQWAGVYRWPDNKVAEVTKAKAAVAVETARRFWDSASAEFLEHDFDVVDQLVKQGYEVEEIL